MNILEKINTPGIHSIKYSFSEYILMSNVSLLDNDTKLVVVPASELTDMLVNMYNKHYDFPPEALHELSCLTLEIMLLLFSGSEHLPLENSPVFISTLTELLDAELVVAMDPEERVTFIQELQNKNSVELNFVYIAMCDILRIIDNINITPVYWEIVNELPTNLVCVVLPELNINESMIQ